MSLTLAVQRAVISALSGALSADVYATPPNDAAMPYVAAHPVEAMPQTGINRDRDRITVFLTAWTDGPGNTQAEQILETIRTTLDHATLTLDTGRMVRAYITSRSTEPDIDERVHIGRATVRVIATR